MRLADDTIVQGDLLVGADGLKSVICQQIVGNVPATYTGDAAWRITVPVECLPQNFMDQVMMVWMGPGRHVVTYYLRAGALLNFVGLVETDEVSEESWTAKFPWERFKADFEGWHADVQTIIDAADRDGCYRWSLHYRPAITNWSTRRATLLGDSVHPTLPYLAQGACMAIEDGAVLTRALDHADRFPMRCRFTSAIASTGRCESSTNQPPIARSFICARSIQSRVVCQAGRRSRPKRVALLLQSSYG